MYGIFPPKDARVLSMISDGSIFQVGMDAFLLIPLMLSEFNFLRSPENKSERSGT